MATQVYGASDDLIECEGDLYGETGGGDDPTLLAFSDGTICTIQYGKSDLGIWQIIVLREGDLFDRLDLCTDEDAKIYSDVLHLKDGIKWGRHADSPSKIN